MAWTRSTPRSGRPGCRPGFEPLEIRNLLSNLPPPPLPIPAGSPSTSPPIDAADAQTGASTVRAHYQVDGSGLTAAVIDTGVDYQIGPLGGGFGPGHKVIDGADLADNRSDPSGGDPHGTAVAGIIASNDPAHPGVAPGADIAALRVFPDQGKPSYDTIADALQWVIDHHSQDHISVVNLSLTDGGNYVLNLFSQDGGIGQRIDGLIQQLNALNIPVVSAAGNSFDGTHQGMGFTAILPSTFSVTATTPDGTLASDAQRLGSDLGGVAATDLGAPGVGVIGPFGTNGFEPLDGTSFAAPEVSGAILLLQQIYQSRFGHLPSVSDVEGWLQGGSDPIPDPVTGTHLGRLDLVKAAALIPQAPAPNPPPAPAPPASHPTPTPPANQPPATGQTHTQTTTTPGNSDPGNTSTTPPANPAPPPPAQPTPPPAQPTPPPAQPTPPATPPPATNPPAGPVTPPATTPPTDPATHTDPSPPASDPAPSPAPTAPAPTPPAMVTPPGMDWQSWANGTSVLGPQFEWQSWTVEPGPGTAAGMTTGALIPASSTGRTDNTVSLGAIGLDASVFARRNAARGDAPVQLTGQGSTPRPSHFARRFHHTMTEHHPRLRGLATRHHGR